MAVLTKHAIQKRIDSGDLVFTPAIDAFQLQPHAVDLRLGYRFLLPRNWKIDQEGRKAIAVSIDTNIVLNEQFEEIILKPGQFFELLPNEFVIATSLESIEINALDLMALLFPRTSTNRRGINLSLSGIIDTGYQGHLIFPMKNEAGNQVIRVYPGERICQILIEELSSPPLSSIDAHLHGISPAKYTESSQVSYKLDKQEERNLLLKGDLDELKKTYPIKKP